MQQKYASAKPRKQFFVQMFTRDISLEDCILDLIDNSFDSLIKVSDLDLSAGSLIPTATARKDRHIKLPSIEVSFNKQFVDPSDFSGKPGTSITISKLHPEIQMRIEEGTLQRSLERTISQAYTLFLDEKARVLLNDKEVTSSLVRFGESNAISFGKQSFRFNGISVDLYAGLAEMEKNDWETAKAGWYVICNGRVVVAANKDQITGWGADDGLPIWHTKYRLFLGLAFFNSDSPELLPWTTSKRGLNRESSVFIQARTRMIGISRPVISFLNNMYKSDPAESLPEREIARQVKAVEHQDLVKRPESSFKASPKRTKKTTKRILYEAEERDIERIKRRLLKPKMTNGEVGRRTFDYFLENECPE
ncbi:MAG: hypothetical protein NTY09_01875 [bacterium]|nr:hypothetical protein [bacterium]